MEDGCLAKEVMEGTPIGRRPPGRPKARWEDGVKSDLRVLGVGDAEGSRRIAQYRRAWKNVVLAAMDHPGLQLQE